MHSFETAAGIKENLNCLKDVKAVIRMKATRDVPRAELAAHVFSLISVPLNVGGRP